MKMNQKKQVNRLVLIINLIKNKYFIKSIQTTMEVYSQIESCIKKQRALDDVYDKIYSSLLPNKKHGYKNLSQQQSLALVYQHMQIPLEKLKQKLEKEILISNQQEEQVEQQHVEDQEQLEDDQQQMEGEQLEQEGEGQQYDENEQQGGQENEQIEEEQGQQRQEGQGQQQQDEMISQDDIGLYGQQLDEQQLQSYENEGMQDDPQFGNYNLNKIEERNNKIKREKNQNQNQQGDNEDEYIEQNFQQFREVQRENLEKEKQQQPTQIQKQINKFEQRALTNKNWTLIGQVKARQRPLNSLIDTDLQFKSGIKFTHEITQAYNSNLEALIKQRILDEIYDDRIRNIPTSFIKTTHENVSTDKSNKGLAQLYEIQFKNSLGIGDKKDQKLKKDIMDSLKQMNYYLDSLSNTGFALKPAPKLQKNGVQAIILEDKVPVTNWNGGIEAQKGKIAYQSNKQINTKTTRLRNKRNARQRKKQQDRKKMNKGIQYGGMTKIQAQARKKIAKSKHTGVNIKYSKSNSFFKSINDKTKPGKPNPNMSKLKI